ncbi:MAG: hypothetical protein Q4F67_16810, partial [Propionibacteriaceae bacterium]|nr:hypothetical protein [Propionibacteriaceae bacterium]
MDRSHASATEEGVTAYGAETAPPRDVVIGGPPPAVQLFSMFVLLALGALFVVGSWNLVLHPESVPEGSEGMRGEFVCLPAGLGMLALVGWYLAGRARSWRAQRALRVTVLGVLAVIGAVSTIVFTAVAPGAWTYLGVL